MHANARRRGRRRQSARRIVDAGNGWKQCTGASRPQGAQQLDGNIDLAKSRDGGFAPQESPASRGKPAHVERAVHAEMCRQEQAEARKQKQHAEEMGALQAIVTRLGTRVCNLETCVERIEHHFFQSTDHVGLLQQRRNSDRTSLVGLQMGSNNGKQPVRAAHFVAEARLSTAASIAATGAAAYKQSMTGASESPDAMGNSGFALGKRVLLLPSSLPALFSEPATT